MERKSPRWKHQQKKSILDPISRRISAFFSADADPHSPMHVGAIENKNYGKPVGSATMGNIVRRAGQGRSRLVIAGCPEFIGTNLADGTYDKTTTVVARVSILEQEQRGIWSLRLDGGHRAPF